MGYLIAKERLHELLVALGKGGLLAAPLRRESDNVVVFEEVRTPKDLDRLDFSINPQFSAKKFFMGPTEELFVYDMQTQELTDRKIASKRRVIFGMRLCDLNAVRIQDALFLGREFPDDHYRAAREHTFLVGWYCNEPPSASCFCESMGLTNYYDLMVRELRDQSGMLYIDVGTPKGELLLRDARAAARGLGFKEHSEPIPPIRTKKKLMTHDVRPFFDHPQWQKTTEQECLSCQRCTLLCPTCMCFDLYDTTREDLQHGARERTWDSCHSKEFTRVAGGHYFRPDRTARFKHRIYHKIAYYPEVFGSSMCTGCGRCIEHCPSKIDFVELINTMHAEVKK